MQRVAAGVYRLEAAEFVNCWLLEGGSDLTLVDAGHSRSVDALCAEITGNGFNLRDVGRVVLTHAHADHAGGLSELLKRYPMKVFAHPQEIPVLTGERKPGGFKGFKGFCRGLYHSQMLRWEPIESAQPIVTGTPVRGLPQWQVIHTPGHTAGGISLFHPASQILICGDVLSCVGGKLKGADRSSAEDANALDATLKSLAKMDCDTLCCGHGEVLRSGAFRHIEVVVNGKK